MSKHKRRRQSRHACPLCTEPRSNPGLPIAIPFGIPTYWSPEAALAIFELIDEMRDIILAVYDTYLQDAAREQSQSPPAERVTIPDDELPFDRRSTEDGAIGPVLFFTFKKSVANARHRFYADPRLPQHTGKKLRICTGANKQARANQESRSPVGKPPPRPSPTRPSPKR